jgi:hypothetical protein
MEEISCKPNNKIKAEDSIYLLLVLITSILFSHNIM